MATGCRISENGEIGYLSFAELDSKLSDVRNEDIANYLINLPSGKIDWHMGSLLKNSMEYFDLNTGNPYAILYHYKYLDRAIAGHPNILYFASLSHFLMGNAVEAEKSIDQILTVDPDNLQALYDLALIHIYNKNYRKSLSIIDSVISKNIYGSNTFWSSRFSNLYLSIPLKLQEDSHGKVTQYLRIDESKINEQFP